MLAFVIAAAVAATTPANAPTTVSPATVTAQKNAAKDPNEMICRNEETLGSRMTKRVCATRAHWEEHETNSKDTLSYMQQTRADPPAASMSSPASGR
ncbi:MAG: hypothetical protein ABIO39_02790 [Caulobacteraceae bacterium]